MIGSAVKYILEQNSAITSVIGSRIYPEYVPYFEGAELDDQIPALVYTTNITENTEAKCVDTTKFVGKVNVSLTIVSRSYSDVQNLVFEIWKTLQHKHFIYNNIRIKDIRFNSADDVFDSGSDTYMNTMTFTFSSVVS